MIDDTNLCFFYTSFSSHVDVCKKKSSSSWEEEIYTSTDGRWENKTNIFSFKQGLKTMATIMGVMPLLHTICIYCLLFCYRIACKRKLCEISVPLFYIFFSVCFLKNFTFHTRTRSHLGAYLYINSFILLDFLLFSCVYSTW